VGVDGDSDRWIELAELAAQEEDPEKLMALVSEINRLLEKKENHTSDGLAKAKAKIARLRELQQALLGDGTTKPDTK